MRPENLPRVTASVIHVGGDPGAGLTHLADALLRMTGDPVLNEAVTIAHHFNTIKVHRQSRRRVLEYTASTLRDQLLVVEQQLHEAA